MTDFRFAGKAPSAISARSDLDQMPDTPTRCAQHRRAQSEVFLRFPDLDDLLLDDFVAELNLDLPPTPPSLFSSGTPPPRNFRSLSMCGADLADALGLDGRPVATAPVRHMHSNSMDGLPDTSSFEGDSFGKKAIADDRLAELASIDPKRAKRILANRQSAARSKERKIRYTGELERKVQTLQAEATTLTAQITLLQRDTSGLTAENKELKLKLQSLEQQAHLRDALNEALRNEVQQLKITAASSSSLLR